LTVLAGRDDGRPARVGGRGEVDFEHPLMETLLGELLVVLAVSLED